jgi:glutamyl-tRNA synthetase
VTDAVTAWALEFDRPFGELLAANPEVALGAFSIGRGGKKPRKDLATWQDAKPYMGFLFDEYFSVECPYPEKFPKQDILSVFDGFLSSFDPADDMNVWFEKIKAIAAENGYTPDMKAYKADPEAFKGSVADVSMFLRLAVTGKVNAPDMYSVMQILGKDKVAERINKMRESL